MKYFHQLTKKEFDKLVKSKITYGELAKLHPQPKWCSYPLALEPLGCWSLTSWNDDGTCRVTGKNFCKKCKLYST